MKLGRRKSLLFQKLFTNQLMIVKIFSHKQDKKHKHTVTYTHMEPILAQI